MFCVLLLVLKDFAGLSIALKGAFWGVTMQDSEHDSPCTVNTRRLCSPFVGVLLFSYITVLSFISGLDL